MKQRKITITIIIAVTIAIIGATYTASLHNNIEAENLTLGQISNIIKSSTNLRADVVNAKVSDVNGVTLTEIAKSTNSNTMEIKDGDKKEIFKRNLAELSLNKAVASDGREIISTTLTNSGTTKFYVLSLGIAGYTKSGISSMTAYGINADYSPTVWEGYPEPSITEPFLLNPGESTTSYIVGQWNQKETMEPITEFGAGAVYDFEIQGLTTDQPTQHWSIRVPDDSPP
jgi:hypothetical protein